MINSKGVYIMENVWKFNFRNAGRTENNSTLKYRANV